MSVFSWRISLMMTKYFGTSSGTSRLFSIRMVKLIAWASFLTNHEKEERGVVPPGYRNRLRIAVLIYSMTNAVVFGAGLITVLNVSALSKNADIWIPVVVVGSLI